MPTTEVGVSSAVAIVTQPEAACECGRQRCPNPTCRRSYYQAREAQRLATDPTYRGRRNKRARESARRRYPKQAEQERERNARYGRENRARITARRRAERVVDPVKYEAHKQVSMALRSGRLQPQPCEVANGCDGRVEAHHEDYAKPLDVRWLCARHHHEAHRTELA